LYDGHLGTSIIIQSPEMRFFRVVGQAELFEEMVTAVKGRSILMLSHIRDMTLLTLAASRRHLLVMFPKQKGRIVKKASPICSVGLHRLAIRSFILERGNAANPT
jgi:hypothetical protein